MSKAEGVRKARGLLLAIGCLVAVGQAGSQSIAGPASNVPARQIGTVKSVAGSSLVLTTEAGQQIEVNVTTGTRVLQIAPGSTSLKGAQEIALTVIEAGDRVLVTGKAGDQATAFEATRVVLMKSSDIAQKHANETADWQKRGVGGIVSGMNAASGALTIKQGTKSVQVNTSNKTVFRRYAGDSVKFEDAKPGSFPQIQAGDQLRVRGEKSADGATINAEEVISGSFKNLAGVLTTVNPAAQTLTLRDLATKQMMTVKVVANSSVHALPPDAAARFATRAKGGAGSASHTTEAGYAAPGGEGVRSAGTDLSQLVNHLPNETLSQLKVGDAVMIVASQAEPGSPEVTAVTLLSGVEPILAATPSGTQSMTLSPWNIGGGAGDSGPP